MKEYLKHVAGVFIFILALFFTVGGSIFAIALPTAVWGRTHTLLAVGLSMFIAIFIFATIDYIVNKD